MTLSIPLSQDVSQRFGKISGHFKIRSGHAFEYETRQSCHPKDAKGQCVAAFCAETEDGKLAILIDSDLSEDHIRHWNSRKYKECFVTGFEALPEGNADLLKKVADVSGYTFKPAKVIWVESLSDASEAEAKKISNAPAAPPLALR